jgi:hypothetical protein
MSLSDRRQAGIVRSRAWHEQRTAAGKCHRCENRATGYYCVSCARARAPRNAANFRTWWLTTRFLEVMALLAQNKCVVCQEPKERFGDWYHRGCREKLRAA